MHGMRMKSHSRTVNFNPRKLNGQRSGNFASPPFYQATPAAAPKEEPKRVAQTARKKPALKLVAKRKAK